MRMFKTKQFSSWAEKTGLDNDSLQKAVSEMERGLNDADLGGHVYKKRVALQQRGKSGGARTIIAFKLNNRAFFMYGFAKELSKNNFPISRSNVVSYSRRSKGRIFQ